MISTRSFFSVWMALWVLFQAAVAVAHGTDSAVDTLVSRQSGPGNPDQNSTTLCGAIQHVGTGEQLNNVTVSFIVPTMHLRYHTGTPQGTTVFAAIDFQGSKSSFKFGINSVIVNVTEAQNQEFFYHWAPAQPTSLATDVSLNPGDSIVATLYPWGNNTISLTITNLSRKQTQLFTLSGEELSLSNFAVMVQDPSLDKSETPSTNSTMALNPPVGLAEFGAVSWTFVGATTANPAAGDYGIGDGEMVYMKNDQTGKYRVAAFQPGKDKYALIMAGQSDE